MQGRVVPALTLLTPGTSDVTNARNPSISYNGNKVAYVADFWLSDERAWSKSHRSIYTVNAGGSGLTRAFEGKTIEESKSGSTTYYYNLVGGTPLLNRNGSRVVFIAFASNEHNQTHNTSKNFYGIMNSDGTEKMFHRASVFSGYGDTRIEGIGVNENDEIIAIVKLVKEGEDSRGLADMGIVKVGWDGSQELLYSTKKKEYPVIVPAYYISVSGNYAFFAMLNSSTARDRDIYSLNIETRELKKETALGSDRAYSFFSGSEGHVITCAWNDKVLSWNRATGDYIEISEKNSDGIQQSVNNDASVIVYRAGAYYHITNPSGERDVVLIGLSDDYVDPNFGKFMFSGWTGGYSGRIISGAGDRIVLQNGTRGYPPYWEVDLYLLSWSGAPEAGEEAVADNDSDGSDMETDCDDTDASVFPGAEELCNEKDDDCDGVIDEGCDVVEDSDADGVPDDIDLCPETPEGSEVNEFGCKVASDSVVKEHSLKTYDEAAEAWIERDYFYYGKEYLYSIVGFESLAFSDTLEWKFVYIDKETGEEQVSREIVKSVFEPGEELMNYAIISLDPGDEPRDIPFDAVNFDWRVDFYLNGEKQFSDEFEVRNPENDSDGDGVPDGEDECPGTEPGAYVSVLTGCEISAETRVKEHSLCRRVNKEFHCIDKATSFKDSDPYIASWVNIANPKKGDKFYWLFKNSHGTIFKPYFDTVYEFEWETVGEFQYANYLDLDGMPSAELFRNDWKAEFYYNDELKFTDSFRIEPSMDTENLFIELVTAHGFYSDGTPWAAADKFSTDDEWVVAVLNVPKEIVTTSGGSTIVHTLEPKAYRWKWVWPDGSVWDWESGGSYDSISPSHIKQAGYERYLAGTWRVYAQVDVVLDGARTITYNYNASFMVATGSQVESHQLCKYLNDDLSCNIPTSSFKFTDPWLISRVHVGNAVKNDELKWIFTGPQGKIGEVVKRAENTGSSVTYAFMDIAESDAKMVHGSHSVEFFVNGKKRFTDNFSLEKPDFVIGVVPLNWQGSMQEFEKEADRQVNFFIEKAGLEERFNVKVKKLSDAPLNLDDPCYQVLWKVTDHGINNDPADRYIGLTDSDYCNGLGFTYLGYSSVYAEGEFEEVSAHELGHTFLLCDEYGYGYWKQANEELQEYWGISCPNPYPEHCEKCEWEVCCDGGVTKNGGRSIMGPGMKGVLREFTDESLEWFDFIFDVFAKGWR